MSVDPLVYIDFAEDGSILYVGATTDYVARCEQHAKESPFERTLIAAHNPPNNWLCRSIPNPLPRPSREECVATVQARRRAPDFQHTVLARRCREALEVLGSALELEQSA